MVTTSTTPPANTATSGSLSATGGLPADDRVTTVARQVAGTVQDPTVINGFITQYSAALEQERGYIAEASKAPRNQVTFFQSQANQLQVQAQQLQMQAQAAMAGRNRMAARNLQRQAVQLSAQAQRLASQAGRLGQTARLQLEQHNNERLGNLIKQFDQVHSGDAGWQALKPHVHNIYAAQAQQVRQFEKAVNKGSMGWGNWLGGIGGALAAFSLLGGGLTGLIGGAIAFFFGGKLGGMAQDWIGDRMTPSLSPAPAISPGLTRAPSPRVMTPAQQRTMAMGNTFPVTDVSNAQTVSPNAPPAAQARKPGQPQAGFGPR